MTSAVDPVSGSVAFSQALDSACFQCERGRTGTLDLANGGRSGVTIFEGMDGVATDVEYSSDGSLFAALSPTPGFGSGHPLAKRRGALGRPDTPGSGLEGVLLDVGAPPGPGEQFPAVKFSPDGSRLYASGFGPTVVFDTASGEELNRIPGDGILPSVRTAAGSRCGMARTRCRSSTPLGSQRPSPSRYRSFPWVADFSPDSRQLAIAGIGGVDVADHRDRRDHGISASNDHMVTAVGFRPTGDW